MNNPNPPHGFFYFDSFLSEDEEKKLLAKITKLKWQTIKMHGVVAKRRVVHFGFDYHYDAKNISPTNPVPVFLKPIVKRVALAMKVNVSDIAEILITEYPVGAGISWHRDAKIFGDKVFGVSLKSASTLKLRIKQGAKYKTFKIELAPGSGYLLSSDARLTWYHAIPAVKHKRYSITFRTLKNNTSYP